MSLVDTVCRVSWLRSESEHEPVIEFAKDSVANHGAGVGSWGADASVIEDSAFERLKGVHWGGAMLMEEHARTEFHRCWFSQGHSPYGGILDDGGEASPLYVDCVFDRGTALHGSSYYGYGP